MNTLKNNLLIVIIILFTTAVNAQNIEQYIREGKIEEFKQLLIDQPEVLNFKSESQGDGLLHLSASFGKTEMVNIVLEKGLDINSVNDTYMTALHLAIQRGQTEVVKLLIEQGANPNMVDKLMVTPLMIAAWRGNLEVAKLLVEHGAIVDSRYIAAASPLTGAAAINHAEVCKYLVEQRADINLVCNHLVTPIYFSILHNNIEMVEYFLKRGAQVNYRDLAGRSPLYIAIRDGFKEIAYKLIEHGADIHILDLSTGRNLLHIAAANGRIEIARYLIKMGIDKALRDRFGRNPLYYAAKHGNKDVYDLLASLDIRAAKKLKYKDLQENHFVHNDNEVIVTKLRHLNWAVSTSKGMLVFGNTHSDSLPNNPSIYNGSLYGEEFKNQTIYHFGGMRYHLNSLYNRQDDFAEIHFINSEAFAARHQSNPRVETENIYFPETLKPKQIKDIEVIPLPGFYTAQRNYLITVDGVNILCMYQNADHFYPWINNTEAIDYVKAQNIPIDILFVGSTVADTGPEWMNVMEAIHEMAKDLDVKAIFPMPSSKMGEYFFKERRRKGDNIDNIYYAINPGDVFVYRAGEIVN